MTQTHDPFPDDVNALKALLTEKVQALADRDERIVEQQITIDALHEHVKALLAHRFGRSSERLQVEGQINLFDEAEVEYDKDSAVDDAIAVPSHQRKRRGKRAPLPAYLPRVDVHHDLPDDQKHCPHDGSALKRIGENTSEELDIVPMKVQVLRHVQAKYACPCCQQHLVTASKPAKLLPKTQASASTLAYVATSKYVDAMPLYRISQMLSRAKILSPCNTLANWMIGTGQGSQALINRFDDHLRAGPLIFMDETRAQVLKEPGKTAESQSQMWVRAGGDAQGRPIRLFTYDPTRSGDVPVDLLEGFSGTLCTDGYAGYNTAIKRYNLTAVNCWAHCRRKFIDGLKKLGLNPKQIPSPMPAKARRLVYGLRQIQKLYAIERRIKDRDVDYRTRVRQSESLPVLNAFKQWIDESREKVTRTSGIGKALTYVHNQWDGLIRYVDDGSLPIDTNLVENAIRPFVVGRKNWMFSTSVAGAKASANLYSLVETAKANGHDPYVYLSTVFERLPLATTVDDIDALLPWNLSIT